MQNKLKAALAAGQSQRGIWMSLSSPIVAEIVGDAGFDWVLVDCEHAPNDLPTLREQLQAMRGSDSSLLARPPWNDMVLIKQFMDVGVQNFIIPYIQTPQEARDAVAATRYPPEGVRGVAGGSRASNFGRNKTYLKESNEAVTVIVQVETMEAMNELEEIAQVPGVDGVFIGPADLSASIGHLGDIEHSEAQSAIRDAAERLNAIGVPSATLAFDPDVAERYIGYGYQMVCIGSDQSCLMGGLAGLHKRFMPTV